MLDFSKILTWQNLQFLFKGAGLSLVIALFTLIIGLVLGTLVAWVRVGNNKGLKIVTTVYVEIIRGTPMLLQIALIYLAIPYIYQQVTGYYLPVSPIIMGIIAIGLNSSAYLSEIIRASINSIDKGQWEAGKCIGLNSKKIMFKIILPQAYKRVLPPLVNEFIVLIKDSSLISTIGVVELMKSSNILMTKYYDLFTPLLMAAMIYLVMTLTTAFFAARLERKLSLSD